MTWFTDQQRAALRVPALTQIKDALESGNLLHARKLADSFTLANETVPFHDFQRNRITALLSWIGRQYGDAALYTAQYETVGPWFMDSAMAAPGTPMPVDDRLVANFLTVGATRGFEYRSLREDDDKFTIIEVNTGGKMIRDGYYDDNGRYRFYRIKHPHPMSFSEPDFGVYNSHIAVGSIIHLDRGMRIMATYESTPCWDSDGVATLTLYKREADIPDAHYARLARAKPTPAPIRRSVRSPRRYFTDSQLEILMKPIESRLAEALASRNHDSSLRILQALESRWLAIRRVYHLWPVGLAEWITKHHGVNDAVAAADEALSVSVKHVLSEPGSRGDERTQLEAIATILRAAMCDFEALEDRETVTFRLQPSPYITISKPKEFTFSKQTFRALCTTTKLLAIIP